MSLENVEIVRLIYEAVNSNDWDGAFRGTHRDFEATFQRGPNAGTHRGRAEVESVLRDQRMAFTSSIVEVEQLFEADNQLVVAVVLTRMRPKETNAELAIRNGHLWTIRDGMVVSLQTFPNPDDALEAAGWRESPRAPADPSGDAG